MTRPHWEYYLAVIQDIDAMARFIHLSEDNYSTYSIELVRILLSVGSEIDVVAKVLCKEVAPEESPGNIDNYRTHLVKAFPKIPSIVVTAPKYGLTFSPWSEWEAGKNPTWWRKYNEVKHQRDRSYSDANLGNVLHATAGLCVLVCYLCADYLNSEMISAPSLFLDRKYGKSDGRIRACGPYYDLRGKE